MVENDRRVRKWSSKTRNGCRTCRLRRVKCDETRPICNKCSSSGRSCEGYELTGARNVVATRHQALLPRGVGQPGQILIHASIIPLACGLTKDETRAFDYFRQHAAFHLSGLFACAVWNHLVLQGSHQQTTILRASIAVGALYQARQTWMPTSIMTEPEKKSHALALSQYSRALTELRSYIENLDGKRSDTAVSVVLITCLLFVSFEMLNGAACTANAHLLKGLSVLSDHFGTKSIGGLQRRALSSTATTQPDIDDLSEIFIRLDADSTMFRRRSPYIHSDMTKLASEIDIPCAFASVKEAKVHLDTLSSLAFEFRGQLLKESEKLLLAANGTPDDWARHYCIAYAKARLLRPSQLPNLAYQRQTLLKAFDRWSVSLAALQSPLRRAVIHLEVAKFLPYFLISTLQDKCEIVCDRFEDEFREIVELAVEFMDTSDNRPYEKYKFVPEAGVLASLYIVGVKCRHPCIRRKAADLLLKSRVQEGLWSGCIYGRCINRLIAIEETRARAIFGQGNEEDVTYVPEDARFSDVIIDTGTEDDIRTARIICARLADEESGNLEIVEDVFSLREPDDYQAIAPPSLWICSNE